jgi:hypothetical protein
VQGVAAGGDRAVQDVDLELADSDRRREPGRRVAVGPAR